MPLIRNFEKQDINQVYQLGITVSEFEVNLPGRPKFIFWSRETIERIFDQGFSCVVEENKNIEGFLLATFQPVTRKLTWENMYLSPNYRNRGLVYQCFQRVWRRAEYYNVEFAEGIMAPDNLPSSRMLGNLGFASAGLYHWMLKIPSGSA